MIVVEKLELVDIWTLYDVAPLDGFQVKIGSVETPVARSMGEESVGACGAATIVVKLQAVEYGLVPLELIAFTRQ